LRILHQLLRSTLNTLHVLAAAVSATFKSRAALQLENLALRHQLWCSPALREAASTGAARSTPMGMAVRGVERLAVCSDPRHIQHGHCLAPQELPSVVESPSRPTGAAGGSEKRPRTDPSAESRESALGSTSHSRGTAQAGHRCGRNQRRQVCVQRRLACSVGGRPTGVKVRDLVAWVAFRGGNEADEAN
jgi:hypothetical protein